MRRYPPRGVPWGCRSTGGARGAQARFRRQVLAAAGGRCQYIEHGERCTTSVGLQAHHLEAGNDDPVTGVALCRRHHRAVDPHAR